MQAIAAEIHERAATQRLDVPQLAGRVGQIRVEYRLDVADAADGAGAQAFERGSNSG